MNFLIIQTQASQGVYYINGVFHCFKIQKGQYMTPFKKNGGRLSPASKAVNDTPLCTEPSFNPELCNCWNYCHSWKFSALEGDDFFLPITDSFCPIKEMTGSGGTCLRSAFILLLLCYCRAWVNPPGTREKCFGEFLKEKNVGGY